MQKLTEYPEQGVGAVEDQITRERKQSDHDSAARSSSDSEIVSDDDDNDEPELLTSRYIDLQQRLWRRRHRKSTVNQASDAKSRKLQERLSALERDILFDKQAAQAQWGLLEFEMEEEAAKERNVAKRVQNTMRPDLSGTKSPRHEENIGEAEDVLFGDMFTAPGEVLQGAQGDANNKTVRLLSFGKWSGVSPRQLLEQTCRPIDPRASVKIHTITRSNYSARHKVGIAWHTHREPDALAVAALPEGVPSKIGPRVWTIEMESVAASTSEQSMAYVSTLMLFLVNVHVGKEQQSMLRLPTVWRDQYTELITRRKQLINESDKQELRDLRKLVKAQVDSHESAPTGSIHQATADIKITTTNRPKPLDPIAQDPAKIINDWKIRTESPAYQKMQRIREELPISAYKVMILDTIAANPITIVCAETGSGKSTQTGSYILEQHLSLGHDCRILVTQPRRISAISLARRVSIELGEGKSDLGTLRSLLGYAIRLESKSSASTRLTFATTGVLLRMLESSPNLDQLDYLILDEVHERTIEMDLLFIALRQVQQRRPSLKIILMSATVDARKFSNYFGNAPILDIPGRTFAVEIKFLEDAVEETNDVKSGAKTVFQPDEVSEDDQDASRPSSPSTVPYLEGYSAQTRKRLSSIDEYRIDYDLITKLATAIATKPKFAKYSSAMLIFMPGIAEIRRLQNAILSTSTFSTGWDVHMLHSSFSTEDLEAAFAIPLRGRRKIVIATNIAETGITIPDVTAVLDACKEKVMRFDERRQLSKLTEGFISRSSAKQRRGRAARVQEGLCFHLVTRYRHDNQMLEQQVPEMMRLGLQDPILRVKIWNLGTIEETFQAAIDPPSRKNVLRAIERLKDAGALTKSEHLTALGQRIARLPLDVIFAKLAILGAIFQCVDPILAVISILTSKTIFLSSPGADPRALFARSDSDILSSLAAYEGWKKAKLAGKAADFCRKHRLSEQNLMSAEDQKIQLLVYLVDANLVLLDVDEKATLNRARVNHARRKDLYQLPQRFDRKVGDNLLLTLIAVAFYPRILAREGRGWRNIHTNQQVSLRKESVNHGTTRPPRWLSFSEAMQTKAGSLNVFETSRIPDIALALFLGEADVKMFSGVISLDTGRVKLAVRHWKQALALKHVRAGIHDMLEGRYRRFDDPLSERDAYWIETLVKMTEA